MGRVVYFASNTSISTFKGWKRRIFFLPVTKVSLAFSPGSKRHVLLLYEAISSFMKLAGSSLNHRPIRANLIRRMWGRDEIGLFNSLYRNMLMQDNDSLIACHYGTYWKPNSSSVTETMVWHTKMQVGTNPTVPVTALLTSIPLRKKMKIDVLHLLLLIYWWCCQSHYEYTFFLLFVDTSAQVIDENSVKMVNFWRLHVFVDHLLLAVSPWDQVKKSLLIRISCLLVFQLLYSSRTYLKLNSEHQ